MAPYIILLLAVAYLAVMACFYRKHNLRVYSEDELVSIAKQRYDCLVSLAHLACYLMLFMWIAAMILMSVIAMED